MDGRALAELRALEAREAELANRAEQLRRAADAITATRTRAEAIAAFFGSYHDEEQRCRDEIAAAEAAVGHRQDEVAAAEEEAAAARNDEERGRARRAIARATDHLSVAELRLGHARDGLKDLEQTARELEQEPPKLEVAAAKTARTENLPPPGHGLQELVEWTSQARAELLVAAGQVSVQRERVVREGNELASMLLAQPTYGLTVAQALRRVVTSSSQDDALGES